jgi:murein DD-endopeptidase MepM/ murein hydrolase activator NlpD
LLLLVLLAGCDAGGAHQATPVLPAGSPAATMAASTVTTPATTPAVPTSKPKPKPLYVFPVRSGAARFGQAHHDYPAADIFAPCGSRVVALVDGTISYVSRTDRWSSVTNAGAARGGLAFSLVGVDGVRYYGSHLRSIEASIVPGRRVRTGELIGLVGNTGDARGIACHLHFGISPVCGVSDWWTRRGAISPYRFLTSWSAGGQKSPATAVAAWRSGHGCPTSAQVDP